MKSKRQKLAELFWIFIKISSVSVGGGLTMLPLVEKELVTSRRLLSHDDMVDMVALTQSMPGLIAINMSTFAGMKIAGIAGAVVSAFAMALPPFAVIAVIAAFLGHLQGTAAVEHIFLGVRAAVAALILISAIRMYRQTVKNKLSLAICLVCFLLFIFTTINVIYIILGAALFGAVYGTILQKKGKQP